MVKYGQFADQMLDLSSITGLSTDELQKWRQLAVDAGVDLEAVANSVQTFNKQLERGNELSPRMAKGFETMNTNVEDFKNLNADEQMRSIADTMLELEGQDRKAFANQMNMPQLLPLISEVESQGKSLDEVMEGIDVPFDQEKLERMNKMRKQWDNLKQSVFLMLGEALQPLFNWIEPHLPKIEKFIKDAFSKGTQVAKDMYITFKNDVLPMLKNLWEWVKPHLPEIKKIFERDVGKVKEVIGFLADVIKSFIKTAKEWYEKNKDTLEDIREKFVEVTTKINDIVTKFFGWLTDFWEKHGELIMASWKITFDQIADIIDTTLDIVLDILDTFIKIFKGDWKGAWDSIHDALAKALGLIWRVVKREIDRVLLLFDTSLSELADDMVAYGKDIVRGLWNGIKDMYSWIKSKVKGFVAGIGNTIKDFFGISSPSKLMEMYGGNIVEGLAKGIDKNSKKAIQSAQNIAGAVNNKFNEVLDVAKKFGADVSGHVMYGGTFSKSQTKKTTPYISRGSSYLSKAVASGGAKSIRPGGIPGLAEGGTIRQGGTTLVGEKGAELLNLPRNATVTPLEKSGITINITGNTIMDERDGDRLGELIVNSLRQKGIVMG